MILWRLFRRFNQIVFSLEIVKVRSVLFQNGDTSPLELPPAQGPTVVLTEKVYVPVKEHPEVYIYRPSNVSKHIHYLLLEMMFKSY